MNDRISLNDSKISLNKFEKLAMWINLFFLLLFTIFVFASYTFWKSFNLISKHPFPETYNSKFKLIFLGLILNMGAFCLCGDRKEKKDKEDTPSRKVS